MEAVEGGTLDVLETALVNDTLIIYSQCYSIIRYFKSYQLLWYFIPATVLRGGVLGKSVVPTLHVDSSYVL